jgi:hypothetical protein
MAGPKHLKPTQFKKGQSGNPSGRTKLGKEMCKLMRLTRREIADVGSLIVKGSYAQLEKIDKDKNETVLRRMMASVAIRSVKKGDYGALDALLNRLVGKVKDEVRFENINETAERKVGFLEFCKRAGYPEPFPKQLEMRDFIIRNQGVKMLMGARGYGKTEYITTLGVAYEIYLDPLKSFLIMTK